MLDLNINKMKCKLEDRNIFMKTILLIEDNEDIKKGLDYLFMQNEYLLLYAKNLKLAKTYIGEKKYDLILLDVTLPDGDGFTFYKEMKEQIQVPVIFLTAKDLEDDIVTGLELGAADYIVKPFHNRELLLRIGNALKFNQKQEKVLCVQDVEIHPESMQIFRKKKEICLTSLEFKIFLLLAKNAGRVVTRETILDCIWDESSNYVNDNTLTVYIKRIREKIGNETIIKTIKGIGYRVDKE